MSDRANNGSSPLAIPNTPDARKVFRDRLLMLSGPRLNRLIWYWEQERFVAVWAGDRDMEQQIIEFLEVLWNERECRDQKQMIWVLIGVEAVLVAGILFNLWMS